MNQGKLKIYNRILKLSERQSIALHNEDMEELNKLLIRKRRLINDLEKLNSSIDDDVELYREVINKIKEVDQENNELYNELYAETKEQLRISRLQKDVHDKYYNSYNIAQEEGIFFDKRNR
ncbi:hypothetical protein AN639_09625 [Candidatus Epulonipiscium fishelsonii]|uniref:Uncharacterized protein n=1 Tax=Candidatus Epulonipiscium fishelsonii TaxID=77094 RepID=A0ACC8XGB5_9FIRM|nr:hypothetical protein AN639_09625 [Epulopiscium sp. SCG-B05WGA-EpuloA1]ONI42572.1 hypothetical protein AN396_14020 [Epulopiscium sp. SCG-B11WGA-EpuloA1]